MGEKEQGLASSQEDTQTTGDASERASNLNLSKSNVNRTITGDPDFDLASVSNPANDLGDGGAGTLAEGQAALQKPKTKSNQSNDRRGHEDDPAGGGIAIDEPGVQ